MISGILKLILDNEKNKVGTPGFNPGAPDPRGTVPMAGGGVNRPSPLPQLQPPDFSFLEGQQNQKIDSAYGPAPKMQQMGGKDGLVLLLGALAASALGAKGRDINQAGQAYTGVRSQQVEQANEQITREDQLRRQKALAEHGQLGQQLAQQREDFEYKRGRRDKVNDAELARKRSLAEIEARAKTEREKQDEMTKRAMIRDPQKVEFWKNMAKRPDGLAYMAQAVTNGDQDAVEAARQLNEAEKNLAAKTQTENEMRPGKVEAQKLKNDWQKITNEFLPETLRGKIALTESQKKFLDTKNSYYPQYLQLALQKLHIAQTLAQNSIGNTNFDNQVKQWELQTRPATDGLEAELQGQLKRQAALVKEIGELTSSGDTEGANAKAQEMSRVTSRIAQIKDRLTAIGESAPIYAPSGGGLPGVEGSDPFAPLSPLSGGLGIKDPVTGKPAPPLTNGQPGPGVSSGPFEGAKATASKKSTAKKTTTQKGIKVPSGYRIHK